MNKHRMICGAAILAATIVPFSVSIQAQATRTWVSGVGDDVNPCSRTAPCKTFAGAISKTAAGGEIDAIDPGGFGAFTITKSITIDGTGVFSSILASGTTGININIASKPDEPGIVRIKGLNINGAGGGLAGIKILSASKVTIENCVIDGFTGDGVIVSAVGAQVIVSNSSLRNNKGAGINVSAEGSQVAISGVSLLFNGSGVATSPGGTVASFRNNVFFGNKKDGDLISATLK